jgi:hypothetical protein
MAVVFTEFQGFRVFRFWMMGGAHPAVVR